MLHNFSLEHNVPLPNIENQNDEEWDYGILPPLNDEEENVPNHVNNELEAGRRIRQQIIANYFTDI